MSATFHIVGKDLLVAKLKAMDQTTRLKLTRETLALTLKVEKYAKREAPVDTGRLRANIHSEIEASGTVGRVTSDVDYAVYVHEGTSRMAGRPYLLKGLRHAKRDLIKSTRRIFK